MDYYEQDVSKIIDNKNFQLDKQDVHIIAYDTLKAIAYLHKNKIMHRDIKPSNILINSKGQCALSDFGLARDFPKDNMVLTKHLVTKWYRAPEIFFGSNQYDESIDIWSFGCVFGELLKKQPIFNGNSELDILSKIFNIRGTINLNEYPEAKELPNFLQFQDQIQQSLALFLPQSTPHEKAIFDLCLQLNPKKRPKAQILQDLDYFKKPTIQARKKLGEKILKLTKQIIKNQYKIVNKI